MAVSILSRTITSVVDKRLVLANAQCGRTIAIGSTWSVLRIGIRFAINPNGLTTSIDAGGSLLFMGLCSGTTNMFGSASTTNALGFYNSPSALNYTVGPPVYWGQGVANDACVKRVGTTITNVGAPAVFTNIAGAPTTNRCAFMLEFAKGSPNFTVQRAGPTNGLSAQADCSLAQLTAAMEMGTFAAAITSIKGVHSSYGATGTGTGAFSEAAGALDTINISWNLASRPLEISDVLYTRIS